MKISSFKRLLFSQLIHQETATLKSKLELYFRTSVNIVDSFANAIAVIGFFLRFFEVTWETARVLYCINFVIFSFRLFRVYFVSGYLGPKIIMIKRMVSQLVCACCKFAWTQDSVNLFPAKTCQNLAQKCRKMWRFITGRYLWKPNL